MPHPEDTTEPNVDSIQVNDSPETEISFDSASNRWSLVLLVVYLLIWFLWFGDAIFGDAVFVYRDSAYWHMPALEWTSQKLGMGEIPLWNDYQGLGLNWVGQGTSTVFYPPTWLLSVPVGPFRSRYACLLGMHVILATVNAYAGARQLRISSWAALLVAIAYSWSSPVLVQHSNWPFLISAAWLPLAVGSSWSWISANKGLTPAVIALTMMILGGDPQGVYVCLGVGLIAALFFTPKIQASKAPGWLLGLRQLSIISLLTVGCSLVQLWATSESAKLSTRTVSDQPSNVYEAAAELVVGNDSNSLRKTSAAFLSGEQTSEGKLSLQFSQTPWSIFSLLSPNVLGTWRDYNRRWEQLIPATDRPWNPNLYIGLIPAILAAASFWNSIRNWRWSFTALASRPAADPSVPLRTHWLQMVVLLAGLTSFGWYGFGWLLAEMGWNDLKSGPVGASFGGLHWLLTWFAPGYSNFRYPAKIWQFAGLGLCFLAGGYWDHCRQNFANQARQVLLPITMLFLLITTIGFAATLHPTGLRFLFAHSQQLLLDPWLGRLRIDLAIAEVQMSLFQTVVVAVLFWVMIMNFQRRSETRNESEGITFPALRSVATLTLIAVSMLDLSIANSWQLMKTDRHCLKAALATKQAEAILLQNKDLAQTRIIYDSTATEKHRHLEMRRKWGNQWLDRPVDKLAWQTMRSMRATWMPQMHLSVPVPVLNADCTLRPAYEKILTGKMIDECRGKLHQKPVREYLDAYLRLQGVGLEINTGEIKGAENETEIQTRKITENLPAVWIADSFEVQPPPNWNLYDMERDIESVWLMRIRQSEPQHSLLRQNVILNKMPIDLPNHSSIPAEAVRRYTFSETEKTADIELGVSRLVCWNFGFDAGWQCEVTDQQGTVVILPGLAVNRIHTGVVVPAGKYHLRWRYRPTWLVWGGPLTLLSWLILAVITGWRWCIQSPH